MRLVPLLLLGCVAACSNPPAAPEVDPLSRTYRLGFSAIGPRPDVLTFLQTIDLWSTRADAALLPITVPWRSLLADTSAALLVRREQVPLARLYRSRGLPLIVMVEPANGLARDREAPELVALGRSLTEPRVQAAYHEFVLALDSILRPEYLGLAVETNLIRRMAPEPVYGAVRTVANRAADALAGHGSTARLYASVQVETAWGRLPRAAGYVGIAEDLRDFPFMDVLGLSSYPYLGGFRTPEEVPLDHYARLAAEAALPVVVLEGGWPSVTVGPLPSSPALQARWIARQMRLADSARAEAVMQITYTDLDLDAYAALPGFSSTLALFADLGLVDTGFREKPALAEWDRAFRRPRRDAASAPP